VRLHWVCPILRVLQPLHDAPIIKARRSRITQRWWRRRFFHFHSRSGSLFSWTFDVYPFLIRHSYIQMIAKRSTASRKTGIRNRPWGPTEERAFALLASSPCSLATRSLGGCVYLTQDPTLARCLSSFDPPSLREKVRNRL